MKKLLPYLLAYLIVAGGTAIYSQLERQAYARTHSPNAVTVTTTLSHDELAAKLSQLGLPETKVQTETVKPSPLFASLAYHFVWYAILMGAFAGLTVWFQRAFCAPKQ